MKNTDLGKILLVRARNAIAHQLDFERSFAPRHPTLTQLGATFVTLKLDNALRGCVGSLQAYRSLRQDIDNNARAAAFRDSRFTPLTRNEYASLHVEVSLLSALEPLQFEDEDHLLAQLRPGIDGVVLKMNGHSGTFLPQVWESLAEPKSFLEQLKRKAGFARDFWSNKIEISRYTVTKWFET